MNPATNATITAPTIRYVLLEPPDPLLRLLPLLFAKIFLFLVRGEIVAHAARLSERPQSASATSHTATTTISGASSRRPARIWGGIILIASATPSGMMRRSWRYPRTGIGSGIRSMGLKACATTTAARARALSGPCKPDTARRLRRTQVPPQARAASGPRTSSPVQRPPPQPLPRAAPRVSTRPAVRRYIVDRSGRHSYFHSNAC